MDSVSCRPSEFACQTTSTLCLSLLGYVQPVLELSNSSLFCSSIAFVVVALAVWSWALALSLIRNKHQSRKGTRQLNSIQNPNFD